MAKSFKSQLRAFRNTQLLDMAETMLVRTGCRRFSITKLAETVGVGKGTVYSHYASQSELIEAVLSRVTARLLPKLPASAAGPAEKLSATVSAVTKEIADSPEGRLGVPCCLRMSPCPYRAWGDLQQALQKLVKDGARSDIVRDKMACQGAAECFQHLLSAAAPHDYPDQRAQKRQLSLVVKLYLHGLLNKPSQH